MRRRDSDPPMGGRYDVALAREKVANNDCLPNMAGIDIT